MSADATAPTTKKMLRPTRTPVSPGSRKSRRKTSRTNHLRVLNCRLRYAEAPSWTARAMVRMFSVPSPAASTCRRNRTPITSASSATTPTITTSVRLPPDRFTSCPTAAARVVPGIRPPRRLRARRCTGGSRQSGRDMTIWADRSGQWPPNPASLRTVTGHPKSTGCDLVHRSGRPPHFAARAAGPRAHGDHACDRSSAGPGHSDHPAGAAGPRFDRDGIGETAHEGQRDGLLLALAEAGAVGDDDVERRSLVVELHHDVAGLARLQGTPDRPRAHLTHRETDLVEPDLVHPRATGHGHSHEPRRADVLRCGLEPQGDGHELRSPDLDRGAQLAVPSGTPLVSSNASAKVAWIGKTLVRPVIRKTLRIFSWEHTRLSVPSYDRTRLSPPTSTPRPVESRNSTFSMSTMRS